MQEVLHSVSGHIHEANVILTITGHELLFISLDFIVQNDYGCCMTGCEYHIHDNMLWVLSLWQQELASRAKIDEVPKWLYSWQVLACFLWGSSACIHVCTSIMIHEPELHGIPISFDRSLLLIQVYQWASILHTMWWDSDSCACMWSGNETSAYVAYYKWYSLRYS